MKRIEVQTWNGKDEKGNDVEENTIVAIEILLNSIPQERLGKGLDTFRIFYRLTKAFEDAKETKVLILDDADHDFITNFIKSDIPSNWAKNKNIFDAIESFIDAKDEIIKS